MPGGEPKTGMIGQGVSFAHSHPLFPRVITSPARNPRDAYASSRTIAFFGPWAPTVRVCSMSAVLLGPERNEMFRGVPAARIESASSIRPTTEATGTIDTGTAARRPGRRVHPPAAQCFPKVGHRLFHRPAEENPAGSGERFLEQRDAVAFRRQGRSAGKRLPGTRAVVTPARRGKPAEQRLPLVHHLSPS